MSTTDFWDLTDPEKPLGLKDPDARIPLYISWAEWVAQEGATYASHEIFINGVAAGSVTEGMLADGDSYSAEDVLTIWVIDGEKGAKYAVTVRFTGTVGAEVIRDDRTVYVKIKDR